MVVFWYTNTMKLYRFSPIENKEHLMQAVEHIHFSSYQLCKDVFGKYLSNAGNLGVFCHYDDEYKQLIELRKEMTEESDNFNQKYFKLHEPIIIPAKDDVPETEYAYLYIRQPDPYRHHVGDIDFYLSDDEYDALKEKISSGGELRGARLFQSPTLDMVELHNPDADVLAYVSTHIMTDIVKSTKSES